MAHELTFNKQGEAQMFSVGETPWHRYGKVLVAAPSYDDAIKMADLDYEVVKVNTWLEVGDDEFIPSTKAFVSKRVDTGKELGAVGTDWVPVQNHEGFAVLKPLIEEGLLHLETGGSLRDGADAWLMGRWNVERFGPIVREVFTDQIIPFSTVMMNHSGRRGILLGNTPIRVVCANTLAAAETDSNSRWETIRHTGDAGRKMVEAAERIFGGIVERYEVIARQYQTLKACSLTMEEFDDLVCNVIAPWPQSNPRWNPEARLAEMVIHRTEKKRDRLVHLWRNGRGHVGDGSAWEAYNGAVEALDHDEELWPNRGGVYRTASLLNGTLGGMKNRVLDTLVMVATERAHG